MASHLVRYRIGNLSLPQLANHQLFASKAEHGIDVSNSNQKSPAAQTGHRDAQVVCILWNHVRKAYPFEIPTCLDELPESNTGLVFVRKQTSSQSFDHADEACPFLLLVSRHVIELFLPMFFQYCITLRVVWFQDWCDLACFRLSLVGLEFVVSSTKGRADAQIGMIPVSSDDAICFIFDLLKLVVPLFPRHTARLQDQPFRAVILIEYLYLLVFIVVSQAHGYKYRLSDSTFIYGGIYLNDGPYGRSVNVGGSSKLSTFTVLSMIANVAREPGAGSSLGQST
ncbi:hypothetical protein HD553DRAFT_325472 [Filobasidium floriforme]|uniref:uncharacterized protein n=1 Tax=Filobasidium floriforme TaxID=5210 RepID=UPI001E8D66CE|nr:uncharacterized protein HD553DRAFT_325472 [Filobasidium floriforme]KAH8081451.1 hypothetical protein HD553DRAFT_325472 [Filobasidium floriforme]